MIAKPPESGNEEDFTFRWIAPPDNVE